MPTTQGTFRIIAFNGPDGQDYKYIIEGFLLKGPNNEFVSCRRMDEVELTTSLNSLIAFVNNNDCNWQVAGRHYNFETSQATFQIQYGSPRIHSESIVADNNEIPAPPSMSFEGWLVSKRIKQLRPIGPQPFMGATGQQPIYKKTRSGKCY